MLHQQQPKKQTKFRRTVCVHCALQRRPFSGEKTEKMPRGNLIQFGISKMYTFFAYATHFHVHRFPFLFSSASSSTCQYFSISFPINANAWSHLTGKRFIFSLRNWIIWSSHSQQVEAFVLFACVFGLSSPIKGINCWRLTGVIVQSHQSHSINRNPSTLNYRLQPSLYCAHRTSHIDIADLPCINWNSNVNVMTTNGQRCHFQCHYHPFTLYDQMYANLTSRRYILCLIKSSISLNVCARTFIYTKDESRWRSIYWRKINKFSSMAIERQRWVEVTTSASWRDQIYWYWINWTNQNRGRLSSFGFFRLFFFLMKKFKNSRTRR